MSALPSGPIASQGPADARPIIARTRGHAHGGIVRLVSPSDIGELIKPFVFLDAFDIQPAAAPKFGWHPHSGIATLTVIFGGTIGFEETTGRKGTLDAGGIEWMRAGGGVWHSGSIEGTQRATGFQLWVALGPDLESGPAESRYLNNDEVPVRVVLGRHGQVTGRIPAPSGINYLDVRLRAAERWNYQPPPGHTVGWIAVQTGAVCTPEPVTAGTLAVFAENDSAICLEALADSRLVLGSAIKHPHPLVLGCYSVHTSREALLQGEAEIQRIGASL
jgi:redox-sensitive bicupin YhaK (pirin superfamily)